MLRRMYDCVLLEQETVEILKLNDRPLLEFVSDLQRLLKQAEGEIHHRKIKVIDVNTIQKSK